MLYVLYCIVRNNISESLPIKLPLSLAALHSAPPLFRVLSATQHIRPGRHRWRLALWTPPHWHRPPRSPSAAWLSRWARQWRLCSLPRPSETWHRFSSWPVDLQLCPSSPWNVGKSKSNSVPISLFNTLLWLENRTCFKLHEIFHGKNFRKVTRTTGPTRNATLKSFLMVSAFGHCRLCLLCHAATKHASNRVSIDSPSRNKHLLKLLFTTPSLKRLENNNFGQHLTHQTTSHWYLKKQGSRYFHFLVPLRNLQF